MTEEPVAEDLRAFILEHIGSVAALEALLLLRANGGVNWDAAGAARRLYIAPHVAAEVLAALWSDGLLNRTDNVYFYSPATDSIRDMVDRLAEAYGRYLIPVTNIIHNNPLRLRRFADAFRFRKGS